MLIKCATRFAAAPAIVFHNAAAVADNQRRQQFAALRHRPRLLPQRIAQTAALLSSIALLRSRTYPSARMQREKTIRRGQSRLDCSCCAAGAREFSAAILRRPATLQRRFIKMIVRNACAQIKGRGRVADFFNVKTNRLRRHVVSAKPRIVPSAQTSRQINSCGSRSASRMSARTRHNKAAAKHQNQKPRRRTADSPPPPAASSNIQAPAAEGNAASVCNKQAPATNAAAANAGIVLFCLARA